MQNPPIKAHVIIDHNLYPFLYKKIQSTSSKMRAEKIRQLAALGLLLEDGELGQTGLHGTKEGN